MMQDIQDIPPAVHDLARQMLEYETDRRLDLDVLETAIEHVYTKLRRRLADLIGQAGFTALFGRALHLARHESAILAAISIDAHLPNNLLGTREFAQAHTAAATSAFVSIVAHFIWLLESFIGEQLSTQLIADIWPQLLPVEAVHGGTNS